MMRLAGAGTGLALVALVFAGPALPPVALASLGAAIAVALGAVLAAELRTNWHVIASRFGLRARRAPSHYVRALFADYAEHFDAHLLERLRYRAPNLAAQALDEVLDGPVEALLDLGCGTGLCGPLLAPLARRLVGVDLSPEMLTAAAARQCYDALHEADIEDFLRYTPHRFDVCVAIDALVYLGDLVPSLNGAARVLPSAGFFVFTTEQGEGDGWHLTSSGRFAHAPGYVRKTATETGFEVVYAKQQAMRTESERPVIGQVWLLRRR